MSYSDTAGKRYQEGYTAGHSKGMEDCEPEIARLRAELALAREAIEQALDDMGDGGHCVCPETKELLMKNWREKGAALAKTEGKE